MKISYKTLNKYIKDLKDVETIAKKLVMHTAEVEDITYEGENLKDVFIWEIKSCKKHPDSEKLNCTIVEVNNKLLPIVCWASNVREWLKVPVAVVWAKLKDDFVITKVKIRWEVSEWMICSEDELWLVEERQAWILELPSDTPLNMSFREYIWKNDVILEIDNKAINHRPDLFSHIWIAREIQVVEWKKLDYEYIEKDFSKLPSLWIEVEDKDLCPRYIWVKVENVKNIESPEYIKQVLSSAWVNSKWLLVDLSNYSLYLYGQPTHIFDADKIEWNIRIRKAEKWEKIIALNDNEYELSPDDIVIADSKKVLAIWWIIWWKESAVSESTKNIIIESANFDQANVRKTWKRLWVRTDSLNVFEKDIVCGLQIHWASLIVDELEKNLKDINIIAYSDIYSKKQKEVKVSFDLNFINRLIWKEYSEKEAKTILENLWIKINWNELLIPFWRKDLNFKADIAEEIARIDWYDKIKSSLPELETKAITQSNIYNIKRDSRDYFSSVWYFDLYTYSFVSEELMNDFLSNTKNLIPLKNPLSEELTHMRDSLIPNILQWASKNILEYSNAKLFEIEKVFSYKNKEVTEYYSLAWIEISEKETPYYDIQNTLSNFLNYIWVYSFNYEPAKDLPSFAHPSRTANIMVRWEIIWVVGEIHPKVASNLWIENRIAFFEVNAEILSKHSYQGKKAKDLSQFQENEFDLNFVIDKSIKASLIKKTIEKSNKDIIRKVELIDIYENESKLEWKRSLTFKIYIQSMEKTLNDNDKAELITKIIQEVKRVWWELRN